eukprot:108420_1
MNQSSQNEAKEEEMAYSPLVISRTTTERIITKDTLHEMHQKQLRDGRNNKRNELKIMEAIGGIDDILNTYLTHKDVTLNDTQMKQLHKILAVEDKNAFQKDLANYQPIFEYRMDIKKTYLNTFFTNKAETIYNILHSNITQIFLVLSIVIWIPLRYTMYGEIGYGVYRTIISLFFWIPFGVFYLLSVNKKAFNFIIRTFEFWFKFYYYCSGFIADFIYSFIHNDEKWWHIVGYFCMMTSICMAMIIISLFDGYPMDKKWKCGVSGLIAIVFTAQTLWWQFTMPNDGDSIVSVVGIEISLKTIMVTSGKITAIFVFKQCILTLLAKSKAAFIRVVPNLKWYEQTKTVNNVVLTSIGHTADDEQTKTVNNAVLTSIGQADDDSDTADDEQIQCYRNVSVHL